MKKTFIVLCGIIIIFIITFWLLYYNNKMTFINVQKNNEKYEEYTENQVLGFSLINLMNMASDENIKNGIERDENGIFIENDTNSIRIEIKFSEADKVVAMEKIHSLGDEQFLKNYRTMSFQCTKVEYHEKTNRIKYLLFEQV